MPTYKHPCPYCDRFIDRAVAACPYCGIADPFSPRRCTSCRASLDDPAWVVCPKCGTATGRPGSGASPAPAAAHAPAAPSAAVPPAGAAPTGPATRACAGCSAPLPEGARFCTVCGTLAG